MVFLQKLNGSYRRIGINVVSLGFVQVTNYVLPLVTFPYLVRIIGTERFGTVNYALTIMLYLVAVTDYGFGLSATREVTIHRNDFKKLSKVFITTLTAKFVLFVIVIFILIICIFVYPRFRQESYLYASGVIYIMGNIILPIWFFQGIEKMKYITLINLISKIITVLLVFSIIKKEADYTYVLLIYGISNLLAGIVGVFIAIKVAKLVYRRPIISEVKNQLVNGWAFFSMYLSTILFNSSTILLLGIFVSDVEIGKYSISEKVALLILQILIVVSQSIYPHLCKLAEESHENLVLFVRRVTVLFGSLIFFLCTLMYIFSDKIIFLLTGQYQKDTANILSILSFHGFIVFLNVPVYQTLLAYKLERYTAKLFNILVIINIILTILFCWKLGVYGAAIASILTQTIITTSLVLLLEVKFKQYSLF